ncbi:MAG TPA: hypothetical protein VD866_25210 [Urbifossiella sp.]|nr:hypothetical protein [Urbifossiella sp.]
MFPIKSRLSESQRAERRRQDALLAERFAGQVVAYVDTWAGEKLTREVVAASSDPSDFQNQLAALSQDTRRRARLTDVPDLDPALPLPSVGLA